MKDTPLPWSKKPTARILSFVILLVLLASSFAAEAADLTFPKLTGRVIDEAAILTAETTRAIDRQLAEHERATTNQVVVVTVKSLQGLTIEEFGYQLGRHWGIGQEGKNNGVLLVVAPDERKVRIEVGYGLEGTLTDALAKTIIERSIVPEFKAGAMGGGVTAGVKAIVEVLGTSPDHTQETRPPDETKSSPGAVPGWLLTTILWAAVILVGVLHHFDRRQLYHAHVYWSGGRREDPYFDGTFGGGVGGGGIGGGFGGGGFSSGGGGFGGGGASGGW